MKKGNKLYCGITQGTGLYFLFLLFFWPQNDGYNQPNKFYQPTAKKVRRLPPVPSINAIAASTDPAIDSMKLDASREDARKAFALAAKEKVRADKAEADKAEALAKYAKLESKYNGAARALAKVKTYEMRDEQQRANNDLYDSIPDYFPASKFIVAHDTIRIKTKVVIVKRLGRDRYDSTVVIQ